MSVLKYVHEMRNFQLETRAKPIKRKFLSFTFEKIRSLVEVISLNFLSRDLNKLKERKHVEKCGKMFFFFYVMYFACAVIFAKEKGSYKSHLFLRMKIIRN